MNLLRRSLPGTIALSKGAPPVPVNVSNKDSKMAGSGFLNFTKVHQRSVRISSTSHDTNGSNLDGPYTSFHSRSTLPRRVPRPPTSLPETPSPVLPIPPPAIDVSIFTST
jgi:hypothetical protein